MLDRDFETPWVDVEVAFGPLENMRETADQPEPHRRIDIPGIPKIVKQAHG